jgi:isopenicillin N synthase-like dioxygenase
LTKKVSRRDGTFIQAHPIPNAVLINTGDLLQRWTSDRIMAVVGGQKSIFYSIFIVFQRHRVLIPNDVRLYSSERRSIAFFFHPDDDVLVKPLDGSNKYEPVTAYQHVINQFKKSY